ncbi:flagellar hook-length control protein FliK [Roseovarius mucosus]|uniref:flagellar hook-length control protein FliK n=1 Tax=Roseovarius mucosus TaxID=215743 RepID=UPI003BABE9A2
MIAPVLTSLPNPAATAPARGATALGQGAGVPNQGFSALLDAAQAPAQPPAQLSTPHLGPITPSPTPAVAAPVPTAPVPTPVANPVGVQIGDFQPPRITIEAVPPQPDSAPEAQITPEDIPLSEAASAQGATDHLPIATPAPEPGAVPLVAAQVAQAASELDIADTAEPTESMEPPETAEALPLAAPALPIAAPLMPAPPPTAPAGNTAPATAALSADPAPLAPAEPSGAAPMATAEATPMAAPQAALQTAAPAPLTSAPLPQTLDLAAPNWPEQMVQDIQQGISADIDTLTLTLTPERLGPLQIRLETQGGVTHVHIVTESPEAARAMAEAQPRLAEAMARAGLEMGSQSTTTTGGSGGAAGFGTTGGDANPRGNGQPGTEPGLSQDATAHDDSSSHPRSPRAPARSSIDLIA